jgi:hypothetical protein
VCVSSMFHFNGERATGNYTTMSEPEIAYQSFRCLKKLAWIFFFSNAQDKVSMDLRRKD